MANGSQFLYFIRFIALFFLFATENGIAQVAKSTAPPELDTTGWFDIKKASYFLPQYSANKKYAHAIAVFYVVPPRDWTQDIINVPFFNYSCKYSLAKGFSLQGDVSTIFISNRIAAGPSWNYSSNNFHLGLGYQAVYNYGILKQFEFKTILTGWEQQPSLTAGYSFENTAVIVRGDLYYTTGFHLKEEGFTVSNPQRFLNGGSVTTRFEQRLHKNKLIALGLKINYLRYHIIAWPALPVNSYHYVIPEFQICFIL